MLDEIHKNMEDARKRFNGDFDKALEIFNASIYRKRNFYAAPIYNEHDWNIMCSLYEKEVKNGND